MASNGEQVVQKVEARVANHPIGVVPGEDDPQQWPWSVQGPVQLESPEVPSDPGETDDERALEGIDDPDERREAKLVLKEMRSTSRKRYIHFASKIVLFAEMGHDIDDIAGLLGVTSGVIRSGFMREFGNGRARYRHNIRHQLNRIAADDKHKGQMQALTILAKDAGLKDSRDINHHVSTEIETRDSAQKIMLDPELYDMSKKLLTQMESRQNRVANGN